MRRRRGFALITVLWLVVALGMLVTAGLADADVGRVAAENRIHLRRSFWAAQACLAAVRARYAEGDRSLRVERLDLGRGVECQARPEDPSERIHVNRADSATLARLFGDELVAAAVLDWIDADSEPRPGGAEEEWYRHEGRIRPRNGPVADVLELLDIRGLESSDPVWLEAVLTVRGDGRLDPNHATADAVRALSLLSSSEAERLLTLRAGGRRFDDAEELANAVWQRFDAADFRELTRRTVFDRRERVVEIVGVVRVTDRVLGVTIHADVVALPDRLAVRGLEVR